MTFEALQKYINTLTEKELKAKENEIGAIYAGSLRKVRAEISEVYARYLAGVEPDDIYNIMIQYDRLQKLERRLLEILNADYKEIAKKIEQSSRVAISNAFYRSQYAINWVAPYSFVVLNQDAIDFSVLRSPELLKQIIKKDAAMGRAIAPTGGKTLKKIILDNRAVELSRVITAVNQGLLTGDSYKNLSRTLGDTFDGNYNNSLRVVRTEGHRNAETGKFIQSREAAKKGVQAERVILSVLDNRTREQSARVDGRKDTGEGFLYPDGNRYFIPGNTGRAAWDINDRETTIQTVDGVPPTLRRARNPVTGQNEIIDFQTFDPWAKEKGLRVNVYGEIVLKN